MNYPKSVPQSAYVSCIRINGKPILPPLINPSSRGELLSYRKKATEIERRIKSAFLNTSTSTAASKEKGHGDAREAADFHQTFDLDVPNFKQIACVSDLEVTDSKSQNDEASLGETPSRSSSRGTNNSVILQDIEPSFKYVPYNLSKDLIDVSEYSDSGMKVFNQMKEIEPLETPSCKLARAAESEEKTKDDEDLETPKTPPTRPHLVRSNSYVLDTPSPILLAHLEKQARHNLEVLNQNKSVTSSKIQCWISTEDDSSDESKISDESGELSSIKYMEGGRERLTQRNEMVPTIEVITTDITVQEINITTPMAPTIDAGGTNRDTGSTNRNAGSTNRNTGSADHNTGSVNELMTQEQPCIDLDNYQSRENLHENVGDSESQLKAILCKLPDEYSRQILELLEQQKMEQKRRIESFEKMMKEMHSDSEKSCKSVNVQTGKAQRHLNVQTNVSKVDIDNCGSNNFDKCDASIQMGVSQVARNSVNVQTDVKSQGSRYLDDVDDTRHLNDANIQNSLECNNVDVKRDDVNIPISVNRSEINPENDRSCDGSFSLSSQSVFCPITRTSSIETLPSLLTTECDVELTKATSGHEVVTKRWSCSRELFPALEYSKKERAACRIQALVRGYLVRRLMKTEKVQILIDTIKDALLCAIDLHKSDVIEEADVELHRRLIQQVSAACYAFHDLFFSTSLKEKLNIIAMDRRRKIEKAKRPQSSRSSTSDVMGNSPHQTSVRLTQSLTKVTI